MRFSVGVRLETHGYIHALNELDADLRTTETISASAPLSIDDPRWLNQDADGVLRFRLAPRTKIVQIGTPVEITPDEEEQAVIDAVVANILSRPDKNKSLLNRLRTQAAAMRKRGKSNYGWMTQDMMVEALLRMLVAEHYQRMGT
ncbi:UNVERIFIED_ORG: hypothetical protein GGD47_002829 [Rhizobium etli]